MAEWRALLHEKKNGDADRIDRSVMARIAQHLEDRCVCAVKAQLEEEGWTVLALIYDGAVVRHRDEHAIDEALLGRLRARVLKDTGFDMTITEKELYDATPELTLWRPFEE